MFNLRPTELTKERSMAPLCANTKTRINLEMAVTPEMIGIAVERKPADVCLVPEKRQELTTEGGLDVVSHFSVVADVVEQLSNAGIRSSLFIDPDPEQLTAASRAGAPVVELHTGTYAEAEGPRRVEELIRLREACLFGHEAGLIINAGHGLHLGNVQDIARLPHMNELNIGHSIIARAIFVGLENAVREMKALIVEPLAK